MENKRSWCLVKILSSLLILLFGVKAFIVDYGKDCVQGFKFFTMCYNVVAIIQIIINILLIIYLPHKIFQINYEMHRRYYINYSNKQTKMLYIIFNQSKNNYISLCHINHSF